MMQAERSYIIGERTSHQTAETMCQRGDSKRARTRCLFQGNRMGITGRNIPRNSAPQFVLGCAVGKRRIGIAAAQKQCRHAQGLRHDGAGRPGLPCGISGRHFPVIVVQPGIQCIARAQERTTHAHRCTGLIRQAYPYKGQTRIRRTQDSGEARETQKVCWGLSPYDDFSPDEKTYHAGVEAYGRQYGAGTVASFERVPQPVWLGGNVYYNGAQPCRHEQAHSVPGRNPGLAVQEKGDAVYLSFSPDAHLSDCPCSLITTDTLGAPRISEMAFENPDGTPLTLDRDYFDAPRGKCPVAGPFAALKPESAPLKIW